MKNGSRASLKGSKQIPKSPVPKDDVSLSETAVAFREAAKAYTKQAVKSKASALKTLHREGILTKGGKLAKAYA
jgi:hypothetical protein